MNREPVIVFMAAGMGSRFGGLKQVTPIDKAGHSIIDYSLYDAWKAGFRKVVFIIKKEIEADFKDRVGRRMEAYFDVRYVFQEVDKIPEGFTVPEGRTKPWGTGHAIACAKDAIDGPFAVLNADDFYGSSAISSIYDFLKEEHTANEHAMVGYYLKNTVTENGSVSRGVCDDKDGYLQTVTERTKIEKRVDKIVFTDNGDEEELSPECLVSMNLWGFQQEILDEFVDRFTTFLEDNLEKNPMKCEYYLPSVANAQLVEGLGTVKVIPTSEVWYGMTYKEDRASVEEAIAGMIAAEKYPEELWMEPSAAYHFQLEGAPFSMESYGSGHINRTILLTTTSGRRYVLQKISEAFDIEGLMENVEAVSAHIAAKVDDPRKCLHIIPTVDGASYYKDETGYYRVFDYVDNSMCLQSPEIPEDFYNCALAFGTFQNQLADFPADTLKESIPNFHNTIDRYRIFHETIAKDPEGRVADVQEEIAFCMAREEEGGSLQRMREAGELPLRVTHNDTKLNNVMFDKDTREPLCVVDLDTVMPGLSLYDYGDAIRFGAATAAEDEKDLNKMTIDLELFRIFTEGFMQSCPLTEAEVKAMPLGAKIMTLECGMRFLTDHIDGDHYFGIHRPGQNLDRARTQFKMVAEMEAHWEEMNCIVEETARKVYGA